MSVMSPAPTPAATANVGPTNVTEAAESSSAAQLRADVERTLLKLSQDLYEMEICAGDVVAGQEDRVPGYMREIDRGLIRLQEMSARLGDTVPLQVVEAIDRFRNPHAVYTKGALNRATGENQYANGRVQGLESFRRQLETAVGDEFPEIPLPDRTHRPELEPEQEIPPAEPTQEAGAQVIKGELEVVDQSSIPNGTFTATAADDPPPAPATSAT